MTTPTGSQTPNPQAGARTPQSHCYVHPERRAVAVCAVCNRGVCRLCRATFNGRNYCRSDAETLQVKDAVKLQKKAQLTPHTRFRRAAIYVAAVLAVLNGLAGAVVGFLLIVIGLVGHEPNASYSFTPVLQAFFTYFADVLKFPASQALDVGLLAFGAGIVDMSISMFLLRGSRAAGIAGIVVSILGGFVINTYLVVLALAGIFAYVYLVSSALKAVLIVLGRKYLDKT